jgi:hypothetical protein
VHISLLEVEQYAMGNKNYNNNERKDNFDEEANLERAQDKQHNVGDAETNPQTSGPAENVREKAAEMNDKDETSKEPA